MSFILDALKKVDAEKKTASDAMAGEIARSAAASGRRGRELLRVAAVALGSAGLTAAALIFFATRPAAPPGSPPHSVDRAPSELVEPKSADAGSAMEPPTVQAQERELAPRATEPEVPVLDTDLEVPEPEMLEVPEPEMLEVPEPEMPEVPPSAPPVRIVGQAGDGEERSVAVEAEGAAFAELETLPSELRELVLQGTSVLDGRPVAVISDRRVFEGDFIEGARVIRILERAVELELEGRRFTLTL